MKKAISLTLALVLLCALAVPAMAAGANTAISSPATSGVMDITFDVASTYEVSIPDDVAFSDTTEVTGNIVSLNSGALIDFGETLTVTISSLNFETTYRMKDNDNASNYLSYTIKKGDTAVSTNNAEILSVAAADAYAGSSNSAELKFQAAQPTISGDYADILTFTVAVA
ncbi:MAG: hypothetical protein GX051_08230 [Clostridiales bacterium]|nr:hypothetical protein [Clostridiales bacterium]